VCWRGAAFREFGGLPWADLEASRLDELRLTATEKCADAALRLGRAAQIVADLDQLAAEHPLREESWRLLALALYQSGRQGDAPAALRRARGRLADWPRTRPTRPESTSCSTTPASSRSSGTSIAGHSGPRACSNRKPAT
jgi:hypothetical protein